MRAHYYIINSREDRRIGQSRLILEKTEGWGNQDTLATFGTQDAGPRQTKLKKHNTEKMMSNTRPHQNSEVNLAKVINDQVNVYSSCYYLKSTALLQSSLIDIDYNMAFSILALVSSLDPYQSSAIALG